MKRVMLAVAGLGGLLATVLVLTWILRNTPNTATSTRILSYEQIVLAVLAIVSWYKTEPK